MVASLNITRPAAPLFERAGAGRGPVSPQSSRRAPATPLLFPPPAARAPQQPVALPPAPPRDKAALAALLRPVETTPARILPLGLPAIDAALPEGGLALGRLHEVLAEGGEAGTGFALALLARIAGRTGKILWCGASLRGPELYGPGLAAHGLDPAQVIFARTAPGPETLWAMEEGLRCQALAAVLGEVEAIDLTATRRLQLAAERGGVTALALRRRPRRPTLAGMASAGAGHGLEPRGLEPSAATTRWRVAPMPGGEDRTTRRWRVDLVRCRGGAPRDFVLEWSHAGKSHAGKSHAGKDPAAGGFAAGDLAASAAAGDGFDPSRAPPQCDAAD